MVVFRGETTEPFKNDMNVYGPGNFWDDLDSGDERSEDIKIAKYSPDSLYVLMLVEKDHSRDIEGDDVIGAWKTVLHVVWTSRMVALRAAALTGNANWPPTEQEKDEVAKIIGDTMLGLASVYMEFPKGNDDWVGRPQRLSIAPNQLKDLEFVGDGGHYKIRFKVQ
jgi:hypothetical protein